MTTQRVVERVAEMLGAEDGLSLSLRNLGCGAWLEPTEEIGERVLQLQAPADLIEKSFSLRKTTILVYCRRYANQWEERFRGRGRRYEVVVEILATQDRLELLRPNAMEFVDAVVDVIVRNAGCLGEHLVLRERVEVNYEGAKKGGLSVLEIARVTCTLDWNEV